MRKVLAALCLASMLFMPGCSSPDNPVRVGVLVWPPYELAYLARENGYFDKDDIELVDFVSPAEMVRSYRFGLIDAMFVTSQFALTNADRLVDSRIIYIIDFSAGGDSLIAQAGIDSAAELVGKKVAMEAGPLGAYTLQSALQHYGMSRDDVEIVFMDTPDQKTAFEAGEVDAVATYEPTRSQLLKQGANELFNSESIPLEIIDVVLARQAAIEDHGGKLATMLAGVDRALANFRADPKDAALTMVKRESLSVPEFLLAMEGAHLVDLEENHALLTGEDPRLIRGLEKQSELLLDAGILESKPDIDALIDTSVVKAARK